MKIGLLHAMGAIPVKLPVGNISPEKVIYKIPLFPRLITRASSVIFVQTFISAVS